MTATLYLGPEQVLLRARGSVHAATPADPGWAGTLAALATLLDGHKPRGRISLVLSAQFAPLWLLPGAPTRLSHEEMRGWVDAQATERFGELAAGWRIAFRPVAAGEPILASAIDAGHWAELLHLLAQSGLTAVAACPWPALALARYAGHGTARLALAEKGRITLLSVNHGDVVAVDGVRGESGALAAMASRAALVDSLGSVPLHLAGCGVAGDWGSARVLANAPEVALLSSHASPDFLQERPRHPLAAWLLLAAGLGLAALAGQHYATLSEQIAAVSLREPAAPAKPRVARVVADAAAVASIRPWGELLDRLETLRPKTIALLSLRGDALRGEARITAQARSEADMLAWLKTLRSEAGFPNANLTHHEVLDEEGRHPLLFELQLGWGVR